MTIQQAQFLSDCLEFATGDGGTIDEPYSGRGMFGQTTCGVSFPSESLLVYSVLKYCRKHPEHEIPKFNQFRKDNLGHDTIYY